MEEENTPYSIYSAPYQDFIYASSELFVSDTI